MAKRIELKAYHDTYQMQRVWFPMNGPAQLTGITSQDMTEITHMTKDGFSVPLASGGYMSHLYYEAVDEGAWHVDIPIDLTDSKTLNQRLIFEGAGATAAQLWTPGTTHYVVDNLNDSGPGSLREAFEATGQRYVTVDPQLNGWIDLQTAIMVQNPYLWFDGSGSASGKGIGVHGHRIIVETNNVVLGWLRFALGDDNNMTSQNSSNNLMIRARDDNGTIRVGRDVVVHHCDFRFSVDTNIGIYNDLGTDVQDMTGKPKVVNISILDSILTEPLHDSIHPDGVHGKNLLVDGWCRDITIARCLLQHSPDRNIQVKGGRCHFINNVIQNCGNKIRGGRAANEIGVDDLEIDIIGNYVLGNGPNNTSHKLFVSTAGGNDCSSIRPSDSIYMAGNISPKIADDLADNYLGSGCGSSGSSVEIPQGNRAIAPFDIGGLPVGVMYWADAYSHILTTSGVRINGNDSATDRSQTNATTDSGTWIDSQLDVGGRADLT